MPHSPRTLVPGGARQPRCPDPGYLNTPRWLLRALSLLLTCPISPWLRLWTIRSRSMTPPGPPRLTLPSAHFSAASPCSVTTSSTEQATPQDDFDYLRKGRHRRSSDTLEALWKKAQIYEGASVCHAPLCAEQPRAHSHRRRSSPETVGPGSAVGATSLSPSSSWGPPPQRPHF